MLDFSQNFEKVLISESSVSPTYLLCIGYCIDEIVLWDCDMPLFLFWLSDQNRLLLPAFGRANNSALAPTCISSPSFPYVPNIAYE